MSDITQLMDAIRAGDVETVTRLVEADPAVLTQRGAEGVTPTILALYFQQPQLLPILLAHAMDLDVFEAAAVGRELRLAELLDADASLANAFAPDGFTPLHLAAFFGQDAAAKALLDRGADADVSARNPTAVRPLHSAAAARHLTIAGLIISAGADVNARQQAGYTALHAAAQHGDRAFIDLLLVSGADPDARTDDGKSAADLAADAGHAAIAELLRAG